jgi:glycosyltransferase involved in cell wall biosynthesis
MSSAGTDGVSLEMMKRKALLEEMGHRVAICSAYDWADYPIQALEFDSEEVMRMMRNLYGPALTDFNSEDELKRAFNNSSLELKRHLSNVITDFAPGVLFVHNILCLPVHPVATTAITNLLRETQKPCTAIHHDILSEGAYKFTPTCSFAKSILDEYFPPTMSNLRHWTINSRNQTALKNKGIEAKVIHDTMDFDRELDAAEQARIGASLRQKYGIKPNDIVLFIGTRIVPNKQIELAGHLTSIMQSLRQELIGKCLYHNGVFSEENRVILVLAGRPEHAFNDYREMLFKLFDDLGIIWIYTGNEVRSITSEAEGFYALFPDMYAIADFVLFPTGWEGFGNQLLEAFAAGLPTIVFEYPVFKEDIAPKGVKVVSLGDTILKDRDYAGLAQLPAKVLYRAANEMLAILTTSETYQSITLQNNIIGKKYFGFDVLREHLRDTINWAHSFNV